MTGTIILPRRCDIKQSTMTPTHFQFGLRVFFLKNKHFAISGQDVERAPLCNYVNHVIKLRAVGNELVVQIIDGQELFV